MRLGLCEDYPEETRTLDEVHDDLATVRLAGARALRVSFGWDGLEPEDDRFDFDFTDALVGIAEEQGVELTPYIAYTPAWAAGVEPGGEAWHRPPLDPAEFGEIAGELASRYRGRVRSWELWNEPDNPMFWTGTPEQLAELVRAGSRAVRAADPEARIVLGGVAWDSRYVLKLLRDHAVSADVDVVNIHAYHETWSPDGIEELVPYVLRVADAIALHGDGEPIWINEAGYSSYRYGARVSDVYRATFAYEHTLEHQASFLLRAIALAASTGHVSLLGWYEIKDLPPQAEVIGDENNRHLGILTPDRRPKPAFDAMRYAAELFDDGFVCLDSRTRVHRALGTHSEAHVFLLHDDSLAVVAWIRTSRPGLAASGLITVAGDVADPRAETIDLFLPVDLLPRELVGRGSRRATVHDEAGRVVGAVDVRRERDELALRGLRLEGGTTTLVRLH